MHRGSRARTSWGCGRRVPWCCRSRTRRHLRASTCISHRPSSKENKVRACKKTRTEVVQAVRLAVTRLASIIACACCREGEGCGVLRQAIYGLRRREADIETYRARTLGHRVVVAIEGLPPRGLCHHSRACFLFARSVRVDGQTCVAKQPAMHTCIRHRLLQSAAIDSRGETYVPSSP